jgi:predicted type IV restriction endonuclease
MNRNQVDENGEDRRQQIVLKLDGRGRREMTATVSLTAINDEQQARFDAEVQTLMSDLVRRALQIRRTEHVQF